MKIEINITSDSFQISGLTFEQTQEIQDYFAAAVKRFVRDATKANRPPSEKPVKARKRK